MSGHQYREFILATGQLTKTVGSRHANDRTPLTRATTKQVLETGGTLMSTAIMQAAFDNPGAPWDLVMVAAQREFDRLVSAQGVR